MTLHEAKKLAEKTDAKTVCFSIDVYTRINGNPYTGEHEYRVWDGVHSYFGSTLSQAMGRFLAVHPVQNNSPVPAASPEGFFAEAAA